MEPRYHRLRAFGIDPCTLFICSIHAPFPPGGLPFRCLKIILFMTDIDLTPPFLHKGDAAGHWSNARCWFWGLVAMLPSAYSYGPRRPWHGNLRRLFNATPFSKAYQTAADQLSLRHSRPEHARATLSRAVQSLWRVSRCCHTVIVPMVFLYLQNLGGRCRLCIALYCLDDTARLYLQGPSVLAGSFQGALRLPCRANQHRSYSRLCHLLLHSCLSH